MPQIFQVLRCYKCSVFQVHQTRKDNKWICKLCGEKQSVKRHYGLGTSRDCRIHVQKLNKLRGEKVETSINTIDSEDSEYDENVNNSITSNVSDTEISVNASKKSKWSAYIDNTEQTNEISEPEYLNNKEVVLEIPQKRKRKHWQVKYSKHSFDNEESSKANVNDNFENEIHITAIPSTQDCDFDTKNFDYETQEAKSKVKPPVDKNVLKENQQQHFVPPKLVTGSKWAQFIDPEGLDEIDDKNTDKNCDKQPLFSLCDDSEIDTILDL